MANKYDDDDDDDDGGGGGGGGDDDDDDDEEQIDNAIEIILLNSPGGSIQQWGAGQDFLCLTQLVIAISIVHL